MYGKGAAFSEGPGDTAADYVIADLSGLDALVGLDE